MERYQVTVNKDSCIKKDPKDWAKEVGNPKYILDLLLSIINLSVQTVNIDRESLGKKVTELQVEVDTLDVRFAYANQQ
jgi:hypothetical protein